MKRNLTITVILTLLVFSSQRNLMGQTGAWQPIGPWGGMVDDLTIAPSQTNVLYALIGSTILKSTDYGKTWSETVSVNAVNDRPFDLTNISVHPEFSNQIYVSGSSALARSLDGGENWEVVIDSIKYVFEKVTFNPINHRTLYVIATDRTIEGGINVGGIFKSVDGGGSWKLLDAPFTGSNVLDLEISPADTAVLYAATTREGNARLYKSKDSGHSWEELNTGIEEIINELVISKSLPTTIYGIYFNRSSFQYGLIKSSDGGDIWFVLDHDLPHGQIRSLAVDTRNSENLFATAFRGLYRSENGGLNWQRLAGILADSLFSEIEIDPLHPDTLYLAAELFGVYASEDGGTIWEQRNGNMNFLGGPFAVNPNNLDVLYVILADGSSILRTTNGGFSWDQVFLMDERLRDGWSIAVAIAPSKPKVIYASGIPGFDENANRVILKSVDGGNTWSVRTDSVLPAADISLIVDPQSAEILYAHSVAGIYKSLDSGMTWIPKNQGLPVHPVNGLRFVNDLAFNPLNRSSLYAATDFGLFKSVDESENWIRLGNDADAIGNVKIAANDTMVIYTASPFSINEINPLRRSLDEGLTWEEIGPTSQSVSNVILEPTTPTTIWVITNSFSLTNQIFRTIDDGKSWEPVNDGLPDRTIFDIVLESSGNRSRLFVTTGRGLYRQDFVTAVEDKKESLASGFKLYPNYPNPFNPNTQIRFILPAAGAVSLRIFDIKGRLVREWGDKPRSAGENAITWDGHDQRGTQAASGTYFAELTFNKLRKVTKMTLVR